MLYGEKTVPLKSRRIPESKKVEIEGKIDLLLLEYYDLKVVEIDYKEGKSKDAVINKPSWKEKEIASIEKKSNPADIAGLKTWVSSTETNEVVKDVLPKKANFIPNAVKNGIDMNALRAIANGEGVKSDLFATEKKAIDEIYECVVVERGVPSDADRIYYGTNNRIAFWDRDDATVFYVSWEGKFYRFVNAGQFNKFCKDNQIK